MREILFYHLEQRPLEQILPLLLQKTLERSYKAVIETSSAMREQVLSEMLWTYRDDSFLHHLIIGKESEKIEKQQDILITCKQDNPNSANVRFFVDGCVLRDEKQYERLVYLFDGHNSEIVQKARDVWKTLSKDNNLTYWQQNSAGIWQKKA